MALHPAAGLVPLARSAGATVVILNAEPTPYDRVADAVLQESISEVLPTLVAPIDGATSHPGG